MLYSFVVCLLLLLLSNMEIGLVLWDCPHLLFSEIMNSYLGMVIGCNWMQTGLLLGGDLCSQRFADPVGSS